MSDITAPIEVKNDDGYIAVRYYITVPQFVQVNGRQYAFSVNANLCISWVHPDDVSKVLSITKSCCGGQKHAVYRLANETEVRRWSGVSER